jgi:hypothetical protein
MTIPRESGSRPARVCAIGAAMTLGSQLETCTDICD